MAQQRGERHFHMLFEYAPISLWEQDFSGIKSYFDGLRQQGITDLDYYLTEHPEVIDACMALIEVVDVNQQTLALFEMPSREALISNQDKIFRAEMRRHFRSELLALWQGALTWEGEGVNYLINGRPIDILLSWRILPGSEETWEMVLVTLKDITPLKQAERELRTTANRLQGLFENSPISLWEEDYSGIKRFFDELRRRGVSDLHAYLDQDPAVIESCMAMIRVIDVNRKTLEIFNARSKDELRQNLGKVFRDEMRTHFVEELLHLWNGELSFETEGINYTLDGIPLYVHLNFSIYPGHEQTFDRVLVAIEDNTARHRAEEYLRYLGTHDVMTGLYNRAHFQDEMNRLSASSEFPVTILVADLDGLKVVNDSLGHQAGDNLIRRAAEVLKAGLREQDIIARIGGDEFAALLPGTEAALAAETINRLENLVKLNNKFYGEPGLRFSIGTATGQTPGDLEQVMRLADDEMYRNKREHYRKGNHAR